MRSNHAAIKAVLFVLVIFSIVSLLKKETSNIQSTTLGVPVVLESEIDTAKMRITQIIEDDQHIYVLADAKYGVLQIYGNSGEYLQTVCFHRTGFNGTFKIAVYNNSLYVRDNGNNLYIFNELELVDFVTSSHSRSIISDIDFEANSPSFEMRKGSLWKISSSGDICIIERPTYSMFYQYQPFLFFIPALVVCIFGYLVRKRVH